MSQRYYTETHEWVTADEGVATVGITDFAQSQLGDVVFIELPAEGKLLEAGDTFGTIESVKSASDLIAPVAGAVVEANTSLTDNPGLSDGGLLCPCPSCRASGLASTIVDRSEPRPPNMKRRVIGLVANSGIGRMMYCADPELSGISCATGQLN